MKLRIIQLLLLLLFCILFKLFLQLIEFGYTGEFIYHLDGLIYLFVSSLLAAVVVNLVKKKIDQYTNYSTSLSKYIWVFLISSILFATIAAFNTVAIEAFYYGKSRHFYDFSTYWLMFLIVCGVVGNSNIAYFYLVDLNAAHQNLLRAQKAQAEMQLKLLQQKVDPHFLFNNLSVLAALIERNPNSANEFISRFTSLYRYILLHQNSEIVTLDEELAFTQNYIYLMEQRFGGAYNFQMATSLERRLEGMIIPTAVQGLVENAVKHNEGSKMNPLLIDITVDENYLVVCNTLRPKPYVPNSIGNGLQNLQSRYFLLTDKPVNIDKSDHTFTVKLPLLKVLNV